MRVVHVQRRPRAQANFSVEQSFALVREALAQTLPIQLVVAGRESSGIAARWRIATEVANAQGDVTHILGDITFAALALESRRTIVTVLDCVQETLPNPLRRAILNLFWLKLPVARAARVTAISTFTRDRIAQITGCRANAIVVIPPAVSPRFVLVPHTFDARAPRVLLVGTTPNKNTDRALAALAGTPCTAVIVGVVGDTLRRTAAAAGVPLECHESLTANAMHDAYVRADLLLFPSTYEGFGLPIVEAQATGRAVVTSAAASMPEAAGDAAAFVDPTSVESIRAAVRRLISDVGHREGLVARGLENARRFEPGPIAAQYAALYRDVYAHVGARSR